ncbi:MAG TPA: ThuA domain-containing protein, partial [Gemmataceae bacterium]|nr:ThuA domain-containing protein [Gemmataceae bacterium]
MHKRGFRWRGGVLAVVLGLAGAALGLWAADVDQYDQSRVPIEAQPADQSLTKIALVAGNPSHGPGEHEFFAGSAILMDLLKENDGIAPVMAKNGWPKDPKTFEGAKSVVFYMDGGEGHPVIQDKHPDIVQKLIARGAGFVNLHYAVEYPKKHGKEVLGWLGGYYEQGYSINPTWTAHFKSLPDHPITRGVKPFTIEDEWYYNIRFAPGMKGVTPILKATPPDNTRLTEAARKHPGREEIVAWAYERRDGGRSFGFNGGHFHR